MANVTVNFRIDNTLKTRVDTRLKDLGSNATDAITLLYHYIDQRGQLPFIQERQIMTVKDSLFKIRNNLLNIRDVFLVAQIRASQLAASDGTQTYETELLERLVLLLTADLSWLKTSSSNMGELCSALRSVTLAQYHIAASQLLLSDRIDTGSCEGTLDSHLSALQQAIKDLDVQLRDIGWLAPASMPHASEYDGTFCHVQVEHQILRRPVPQSVTITLRPDLHSLVDTLLPDANPLPTLPGWNCRAGLNYWSNVGVVGGVPREGFRFNKGKAVFHITPETAEPMKEDKLAEYVSVKIEELIRSVLSLGLKV